MKDAAKRWKLSPMDLESRRRTMGGILTRQRRDVRCNRYQASALACRQRREEKVRRLNVIRHLLSLIPYPDLTPEPLKLPPLDKTK